MFLKNAAMRLTAAVLCVSAMAVPALAVSGTVNTGSDKLNLRASASTASAVLTKLSGGSTVEVIGTDTAGWYQVSFSGMTGYVASQYIDLAQEAAPAAETAPAAEAAAVSETAEAAQASAVYGRVISGPLNVRSGPGTDYDKCGRLNVGKTVEILETVDGWYRIENGYVSADYVRILSESELAASSVASDVVELALSYVGYPYVYGGSSPKGFDCSGFTSYIYKQFGYSINRTCSGQLDNGTAVAMSELQPGDLVIFKKYANSSKRASHVGIYIGEGQFVHASTSKVGVIVSHLSDAYYTTGFVGGRRIV